MKLLPKLSSIVILTALSLSSFATEMVSVERSITFSKHSNTPQKVVNECNLQTKIPLFLSKYAKGSVSLTDETIGKQPKALKLEISSVHAPGGGAWSGAKYVEVKGQLLEHGKVIASFVGSRYSTGGAFAGFKGTCSILGRCAKTIGKDIARWLKNPIDGAMLGNS